MHTLSGIPYSETRTPSFNWGLIMNPASPCRMWFRTRTAAASFARECGKYEFAIARWARFNPSGRQV